MGLGAIKGMGSKALQEVINKQPFNDLIDFIYKTKGNIINKSKMEVLAKAGCFDSFKISRKFIYNEAKKIRDKMNIFINKKVKQGISSEFAIKEFAVNYYDDEWSKSELLAYELEILGEMISGDISELFPNFFNKNNAILISRLFKFCNKDNIKIEFVLKNIIREFKIKNGSNSGQKMSKYLISDLENSEIELIIWPDEYKKYKNILQIGIPIRAICQINDFNGVRSLILKEIENIYKK
jgi:DNA polymerase-3 subunit alpha